MHPIEPADAMNEAYWKKVDKKLHFPIPAKNEM
jgi:hypothetical protein